MIALAPAPRPATSVQRPASTWRLEAWNTYSKLLLTASPSFTSSRQKKASISLTHRFKNRALVRPDLPQPCARRSSTSSRHSCCSEPALCSQQATAMSSTSPRRKISKRLSGKVKVPLLSSLHPGEQSFSPARTHSRMCANFSANS